MELMVLMRVYLRNLVWTDALIHSSIANPVLFNCCSSPGSFNSRLVSEEIMIVKKLCEIGSIIGSLSISSKEKKNWKQKWFKPFTSMSVNLHPVRPVS